MTSQCARLRALLDAEEPLILPYGACAFDALMADHLDFDAIALSGAWASVYLKAAPDYSFISLEEQAYVAQNMVMATSKPVIADADQGFGNAVNAHRAITRFVAAGVAGVHIEDQPFPKRCGFKEGKEVVPIREMVMKLQAARDACTAAGSPDFVIIARTDALGARGGSMTEAVDRARAYREVGGADVIYVEGPQSVGDIEVLRERIDGLLFCSLSAFDPHPSVDELKNLGMCVVPLAELISVPAIVAAWRSLTAFQERGMDGWNEFMKDTRDHPAGGLRALDVAGFTEVRRMEALYGTAER